MKSEESIVKRVCTIGFFDGVHRGHQYVIEKLRADALAHGLESMVMSFRQHPRQVLQKDYIPKLLTPAEKKISLLKMTNVDHVVALDFTTEMAQMTARDFMVMMHDKYNIVRLLIGYDNRFGHNRSEGFEDYQKHGKEIGIEVVCNDELPTRSGSISSSLVRRCLTEGNITLANSCLGYEFGFSGTVVRGFGEGRKLGFPTANMHISQDQMVPKRGVYAVRVAIEGYPNTYAGMMNIGVRPTYGEFSETIEVHILDFDADIYDKTINVRFVQRLRDEQRFASIDELKAELARNREQVKNYL